MDRSAPPPALTADQASAALREQLKDEMDAAEGPVALEAWRAKVKEPVNGVRRLAGLTPADLKIVQAYLSDRFTALTKEPADA